MWRQQERKRLNNKDEDFPQVKVLEQRLNTLRAPLEPLRKKIQHLAEQLAAQKNGSAMFSHYQQLLQTANQELREASEECEAKAASIRAEIATLRAQKNDPTVLIGTDAEKRTVYGTFRL